MYTNQLLQEKYKVQKALSKQAQKDAVSYFEMIEQIVTDIYQNKKKQLVYSDRSGGFLDQSPK